MSTKVLDPFNVPNDTPLDLLGYLITSVGVMFLFNRVVIFDATRVSSISYNFKNEWRSDIDLTHHEVHGINNPAYNFIVIGITNWPIDVVSNSVCMFRVTFTK